MGGVFPVTPTKCYNGRCCKKWILQHLCVFYGALKEANAMGKFQIRLMRLWIGVAIAMFFGNVAYGVDYIICGEVQGLDGQQMYVMEYDNNAVIDSAEIRDGRFRIEGAFGRNAFVRVESGMEFSNCVLDSGVTVVDFSTHAPADGSAANLAAKDLLVFMQGFNDSWMRFCEELQQRGLDEDARGAEAERYKDKHLPGLLGRLEKIILDSESDGVAESALKIYQNYGDADRWDAIYPLLRPELKALNLVRAINERFMNIRRTEVGKPFVDIEGKSVDGSVARLSDYVGRGKWVLVDFWASWCGPCRQEAEETLKPLYEKYRDDDRLVILSVATWDEPEQSKQAIEKLGYGWEQMIDPGKDPMRLYGFNRIPMIMLFGPDGTIVARDLRGKKLVEAVTKAMVE